MTIEDSSKITPRLRTETEGCINLPSIITCGKLVYTLDTLSSSVFEVFTRRSFLFFKKQINDFRCTLQKFQVRVKLVNRNCNN